MSNTTLYLCAKYHMLIFKRINVIAALKCFRICWKYTFYKYFKGHQMTSKMLPLVTSIDGILECPEQLHGQAIRETIIKYRCNSVLREHPPWLQTLRGSCLNCQNQHWYILCLLWLGILDDWTILSFGHLQFSRAPVDNVTHMTPYICCHRNYDVDYCWKPFKFQIPLITVWRSPNVSNDNTQNTITPSSWVLWNCWKWFKLCDIFSLRG